MISKGPWKVISSEEKYSNSWIVVQEDQVIRPDGLNGIFSTVTLKSGSSILPLDEKGNVYLTKEYKYALNEYSIEAISGGREPTESFEETAIREMREEAGIVADKIIPLGLINPFTSVVYSPNYLFLATGLNFVQSAPEPTETIEIVKVTMNQALEWAMRGVISHGASVAIILKTYLFLKETQI